MADKYFIGTGNWSANTNWYTALSGGSLTTQPTSSDNAFVASGATATLSASPINVCKDFTILGNCTINNSGGNLYVYGNADLTGGTVTLSSATSLLMYPPSTSGATYTIKGNWPSNIIFYFNTTNVKFQLTGNLTSTGDISVQDNGVAGSSSGYEILLDGYTLSCKNFTVATVFGTHTVNYGVNGKIYMTGDIVLSRTIYTGTGVMRFTNSIGQELRFDHVSSQNLLSNITIEKSGTGTLTFQNISGFGQTNMNLYEIKNLDSPTTIRFWPQATTTITNFNVSGTAGNLVKINDSTWTSPTTLIKAGGGVVNSDYLNIYNSTATPSTLTWYAGSHSTDSGGNSGWIFSAAPVTTSTNFFPLFS